LKTVQAQSDIEKNTF